MCQEQLYKNVYMKNTLKIQSPDIIWRDKNIDEEIERFRINYSRWCENHPEKIKHSGGKNPRVLTADDYILKFKRHIEVIIEKAERLRWPWEWCIDDQSENGKYFCPIWVILGDSRIFSIYGHELKVITFGQQTKKGDTAKKSTQLNDRYKRENTFYKKGTSISAENFVCNYFRKRPDVKDGIKLEAGHIYSFDKNKSCIVNNNMLNVKWQIQNDNKSIQKLFENGRNRKVFKKEAKRLGIEIEIPEDVQAMLDAVNDPRVDAAIEFSRNENGIYRITGHMSRNIVPVN